ncbi:major facilitator superfamily MFS_1 [Anaerovibrio sp. JC8]|uniref:MFS transporter n=1 Tax=Anaerovibrio sp. JC8 TaxID=1240085 RepID=UPI000A0AD9FE|nr:MFS transporter [Anaerovibrio sp. JC8]ORT99823.1 major facilitator superfamily MFS_1 [Anaerovibrio sp. JC8]
MDGQWVTDNKISKGTGEYWRAIIALFCGSLVTFGAEYCVQPIIPVFTDVFALEPATASLAVSFGTGGMAIAMLFIAEFAKKLPRKAVMSIALIVSSVLAVVMAFSDYFGLILLLRFCQGFLLAGFPAMATAYISEEFDSAIVGAVVGIYVSGTSIGGLAGRALLSFFTDLYSWRMALIILGVAYAIIGAAFVFVLPRARHLIDAKAPISGIGEFKKLFANRRLMAIYAIAFMLIGPFVCAYNYISYVLLAEPYNLNQTTVGLFYLLYLVGTFSSTLMGCLSDRIGNGKTILVSIGGMLGGIILSLYPSLMGIIVGMGIMTFGFFGAHAAAISWSCKVDKSDKARITALYMFFYYMGSSLIGSGGGLFFSRFGWPGIVFFLVAILSVALTVSWILLKHES